MRITPLDVRKQEFRKAVRGFDGDEVNAFLATVADEYETVLRDNKELRERILELEDKVSEYRSMEKTLRDTLMTAERVMTESKENAQREADLMLKDAELRAQQVLDSFRSQAEDLRREIIDLHKEKETYLARFRSLAETLIQFIENHHSDFDDVDQRMMNMADTATQTRIVRSAPAQTTVPAAPPTPEPPSAVPAYTPPAQSQPATDPNRAGFDEWRDYDPRAARSSDSPRHLDAATSAAALAMPGQPGAPQDPAPTPTSDSPAPPPDAWQGSHPSVQQRVDVPSTTPVNEAYPTPNEADTSQPSAVPADKQEYRENREYPRPPDRVEPPVPSDRPVDHQDHDGAHESESSAGSSDSDPDRQTDEVVEMLRPMDEETTSGSEDHQQSENSPEQPKPATDSADEDEDEREPVRTWDMESFTRGLGDM